MHAKTLPGLVFAVLAGAGGAAALASDGAPATPTTYTNRDLATRPAGVTPPVYTNADLEKFGPPEPASATPRREAGRTDETAAWAFVQAALDREADRLEEERRYALELEAARSYGGEADGCCSGGRGYLSAPWVDGLGFGAHRRPHRRAAPDPFDNRPPLRDFMGRRDTLHGRPSAEHRGHGRFEHLQGSDAFPGGKAHR